MHNPILKIAKSWAIIGILFLLHGVVSQNPYDTQTCTSACNNDDIWINLCRNLYGTGSSTADPIKFLQCIDVGNRGVSGAGATEIGLCIVCDQDGLGASSLATYQVLYVFLVTLDNQGVSNALAVESNAVSDIVTFYSTSLMPSLRGSVSPSTTSSSSQSTSVTTSSSSQFTPSTSPLSTSSRSSFTPTTSPVLTTTVSSIVPPSNPVNPTTTHNNTGFHQADIAGVSGFAAFLMILNSWGYL
ncbi:hypothetical protein K461DRAFT_297614 [Myriangium duriaei CBS 260.36]|uniref:Uncharacterized protein n=1 Tax=Myriangium duriaei CBS 260.36 TaxID=1168546 RepID=A0A9P4MIV4_9PEZI|nr:hypothetical protein K461DRAFT_297614 [Myriangium duriaei CBS 260.36]